MTFLNLCRAPWVPPLVRGVVLGSAILSVLVEPKASVALRCLQALTPKRASYRFLCRPCPSCCPEGVPARPGGWDRAGPPACDTARDSGFALGLEEPDPALSARASPVRTRGAAAARAPRSPRPLGFWSQLGGTWGFGTLGDKRRRPETRNG
ncbi:hypothetical protein NN561_017965 [Cricetulus griseus]